MSCLGPTPQLSELSSPPPGGPSLFVFLPLTLTPPLSPTITPPYTPVRPCYSPHPFSSVSFYPPALTQSTIHPSLPCLSPYTDNTH